ncbi:hypothetical protein [Methylobacterium sp. AMS5]|uniref:hypothetical protein n=1 Tax=Methylobacterium sp. AMS5 TaxID=925818 RepID=UPI0009F82A7A|nr:hypothetical protein [Methylobacterium sp. AMS5]
MGRFRVDFNLRVPQYKSNERTVPPPHNAFLIHFIIAKLKLNVLSDWCKITNGSQASNGRNGKMSGSTQRTTHRSAVVCLTALGVLLSFPTVSSAQQSNAASVPAGQSIPTEVAVEYATIGSTALPIRILGLNGGVSGANGQTASNQQVGNANRTDIRQSGGGNAAAVQIFGDGNTAAITQQGLNNTGQGALTGSSIRFDLQQSGLGNSANLSVNAPTGANLTAGANVQVRQDGNGNSLTGSVPGAAEVVVNQIGNGLSADVSQVGAAKSINVLQVRTR